MATSSYLALARLVEGTWLVAVDGVGVTQAGDLDEARAQARSLVAGHLGVPVDEVEVTVQPLSEHDAGGA